MDENETLNKQVSQLYQLNQLYIHEQLTYLRKLKTNLLQEVHDINERVGQLELMKQTIIDEKSINKLNIINIRKCGQINTLKSVPNRIARSIGSVDNNNYDHSHEDTINLSPKLPKLGEDNAWLIDSPNHHHTHLHPKLSISLDHIDSISSLHRFASTVTEQQNTIEEEKILNGDANNQDDEQNKKQNKNELRIDAPEYIPTWKIT